MRSRRGLWLMVCGFGVIGALYAFQRPFHQYPGVEYSRFEVPPGSDEKTEWVFARMMFGGGVLDGYRGRYDGDWRQGLTLWTQDYPRADRHFSLAVKRLTRIHTRSVEQPINLEEDEQYDYPWLYAVQVGEWGLTDKQCLLLREYLLRGGYFFADDVHGTAEWQIFVDTMKRVFPDRPIVEIESGDPVFHTVYDLKDLYQVPGAEHLRTGYKNDGIGGHWRAILDDKGRIMVSVNLNSDMGDGWEWADTPRYPIKFSDLAIRWGVNTIIYSMTH